MKRKQNDCPKGEHGPRYNVAGLGLAKWRKTLDLSRDERQEYGAAVHAAVLAMQQREMVRESCEAATRPNCASGCWDEYPGDAVRRQQQTALLSCGAKERVARTPEQWAALYEEAMELKAAAIADRVLAGHSIEEMAA